MFVEAPDAHNGVLFKDTPLTDKQIRQEIVYENDKLSELGRLIRYNLNLVADTLIYRPLDQLSQWFYRIFFFSWEKRVQALEADYQAKVDLAVELATEAKAKYES